MRFIVVAGAAAFSAVAAYPVYLYALGAQQRRESTMELAQFDQACGLARLRLAGGGQFWSARIMANRCDAAGR